MGAPTSSALQPALPAKRSLGFWLVPALVLCLGWGGSGVLAWLGQDRRAADERANLVRLAANAEASLQRRMTTYTDELQAGAAFVRASHQVERDEWREYASTVDIIFRYPGIRGIGVIYRVPAAQREHFLQSARADGYPDFAFRAVPGHILSADEMGVITLIEPQAENKTAIGLDVLSEPNRRDAALRARDTGRPWITRRISLVQTGDTAAGSLLFVPIYAPGSPATNVAERRASHIGWVYAPLLIEELVTDGMVPRAGRLRLAFFEGAKPDRSALLYSSPGLSYAAVEKHVDRVTTIELAGEQFTVAWVKGPEFVPAPTSLLAWAGLGGGVVTLLLVGLVLSLQVARELAEREKAEVAMRQTEEHLARVLGHAECFVWEARVIVVDSSWEWKITVYPSALNFRMQGGGATPRSDVLWQSFEVPERAEMDRRSREAMMTGAPGYVQEFRLCRGGTTLWLRESVAITRAGPGQFWLVGVAVDISDRKRTEAALRDSERRLSDVFRSMSEGVMLVRAGGRVIECNEAAVRISGRSREQLLAQPLQDQGWELLDEQLTPIPLADQPAVVTLRTGVPQREVVMAARASDGVLGWFSMNTEPVIREDGVITGAVVTFIDITRRKRAEADVRESQQLLWTVTGILPGLIAYWDLELRCAFANAEYLAWFGKTAEQMQGIRIQDLLGPELFEMNRPYIEAVLAGKGQQFERELHKQNGEVRHTWAQYIPDFESDGVTVRGFVVLVSDVTELKQKEEALRGSESRLRASLREVNDLKTALDAHAIVAVTDGNGVITYANDRFCSISGYSREELIGQTHRIVNSGHHPPEFFAAMWATITDGQIWRGEICNVTKQGDHYWVDATIVPFLGEDGRPVQYIAIRSDITDRKRLEQNLAIARDQALESSRLKSEFLATMSHEIRTPMNAIIGMATLLTESVAEVEQADMARVITSAAESLLTIINDILDFSRIEAGELRLDPAEFDLARIVEETVTLLAPRAHEKRVELNFEIDPAPDTLLFGDGGRVRQVLMNLIGNAVKFTDDGEVTVTAGVTGEADGLVRVRLAVEDTGVGIPKSARERLFRPFVQLDAGATRRFGGTGLGLAITQQLVVAMGGSLDFESTMGRGSLFWVDLAFPRRTPLVPEELPSLAGHHILVVDDNATNRRILGRLLARSGAAAEVVADGPTALARLEDRSRHWDAVIIDHDMPGVTGLDLAGMIRGKPTLATLPLVLLAPTTQKIDPTTIDAGWTVVLKPVVRHKMVRALERVFERAHDIATNPPVAPRSAENHRGLRLLLVEDNLANQRVASLLLGTMGHSVALASNGHQALDRLAREAFDAVLMDCQMPLLDGYETTRWIRSGKVPGVNARVPVIALTAYARNEDRRRCLDAGMDDYVAKPIRHDDLAAALARLLSGAPPPPVPAASPDTSEVLDPEVAATTRNLPGVNGASLLPELIQLYVAEEAPRLDRIASLLAENAPRAAEELHAFGGNAAAFGGREVRRIALELEETVRAGRWAEALGRLAELRAASARLRTAAESFQNQTP